MGQAFITRRRGEVLFEKTITATSSSNGGYRELSILQSFDNPFVIAPTSTGSLSVPTSGSSVALLTYLVCRENEDYEALFLMEDGSYRWFDIYQYVNHSNGTISFPSELVSAYDINRNYESCVVYLRLNQNYLCFTDTES